MNVRDLARCDFEGLFALRSNRYTEIETDPAYGMGTRDPQPGPVQFAAWFAELDRSVLEARGVCSVTEDDGKIVGMAYIRREDEALETRHVGVLSIEVLPGYRGRGLGSALLEHALAKCPGVFELVKLEVLPENEAAQRLYRKFGFEEHGRLPRGFYRAGTYHDFVLMHRSIPSASEAHAWRPPSRLGVLA